MRSAWFLLTLAACYSPTAPQGAPCSTTNECPTGQECRAGTCSTDPVASDAAFDSPPADASLTDGELPDSTASDAPPPDAVPAVNPWASIAGLVVRFPMDDNPLVTKQVSSSNALYVGECEDAACPTPIAGIEGGAYEFAGAQHAIVANSGFLTAAEYTVSVWAYIPVPDAPYRLALSKPHSITDNANTFGFGLNQGEIAYESFNGDYQILYATSSEFGSWQHFALTWNGSRKRMYIDGSSQPSQAANIQDSSLPFAIGADIDFGAPSGFFIGRLDELRIYNRALDINEIQQLATSSAP